MQENLASVFAASCYARAQFGINTYCESASTLASVINKAVQTMSLWASEGFAQDVTALAIMPDKDFLGIDLKMNTQIIELCEDNLFHVFNFKCYKYADTYWLTVSTDLASVFQMYQYTDKEVIPGDEVNALVLPWSQYVYGLACRNTADISISTLYLAEKLPEFQTLIQLIPVEDPTTFAIRETLKSIFTAGSALSSEQIMELTNAAMIGVPCIAGSSEDKSSIFSQSESRDELDNCYIQVSFNLPKAHMIHVILDSDHDMMIKVFNDYGLKSPYSKKSITTKFGILRVDQFTDKDGIIHHILHI